MFLKFQKFHKYSRLFRLKKQNSKKFSRHNLLHKKLILWKQKKNMKNLLIFITNIMNILKVKDHRLVVTLM